MSHGGKYGNGHAAPKRARACLAVRDAGRHVDEVRVPQVGDPCPLCGRPISCVGLTKCSTCGAGHGDHVPRAWSWTRGGRGVVLEPACDSMERRELTVRLAGREAAEAAEEHDAS